MHDADSSIVHGPQRTSIAWPSRTVAFAVLSSARRSLYLACITCANAYSAEACTTANWDHRSNKPLTAVSAWTAPLVRFRLRAVTVGGAGSPFFKVARIAACISRSARLSVVSWTAAFALGTVKRGSSARRLLRKDSRNEDSTLQALVANGVVVPEPAVTAVNDHNSGSLLAGESLCVRISCRSTPYTLN